MIYSSNNKIMDLLTRLKTVNSFNLYHLQVLIIFILHLSKVYQFFQILQLIIKLKIMDFHNRSDSNSNLPQVTHTITNQQATQSKQQTQPIKIQTEEICRLKSKARIIAIGLVISISALIFGYSVKQITSVHISTIVSEYSITLDSFTAQSILIGILPLGSVFGTIITNFLIKKTNRLTGIYWFTIVNVIAVILININNFGILIAGRFIEGICVGYYSSIAPVYLKEIAPKQLRKMLGLFFSIGKTVGVLLVIILELSFDAAQVKIGWRVILSMTAGFSVIQAILIFFLGSQTPTECLEHGDEKLARAVIQNLYLEEYRDQIFQQYMEEHQMELAKNRGDLHHKQKNKSNQANFQSIEVIQHAQLSGKQIQGLPIENQIVYNEYKQPVEQLTYDQKRNYAYYLGLHLSVIRHWVAGNAIISQGGQFVGVFDAQLGKYTSIIINSIQFVCIIIGLIYIQKIIGKRPLFLFSITILSFINLGVAVAMIFQKIIAIQILLCVYMVVYGGSFISPIWAYPSQILPASQNMLPNIFHWIALALSTLIPPIVSKAMPHNNPYPVFIFFGLYGLLSLIHIFKYLRESDGLSYNEIIKSFK